MSELLRGPVTVANLTAAAGVTTTVDGWWPCLDLTWRTPVPASITKITAHVRERGTTSPVAETVMTAVDLAAGTAKVVNGVSVGQHLEVRLSPAGAPGLPFQSTPWLEVTTSWDALMAALDGLQVGCVKIVCGVGAPTRTDLPIGSLYVEDGDGQLWQYVADATSGAPSGVNIVGTNLDAGTNTATYSGLTTNQSFVVSKPRAAASAGLLTWDAYKHGTAPAPNQWQNYLAVYGNTGGADTLLFLQSTTLYGSSDAAFNALADQLPQTFTGYTEYRVECLDDTLPSDNTGGLSVRVDVMTPGWILTSDLTSIRLNGVEVEDSPRSLDVVDANGVLVATTDGAGAVSLALNTDTDTTLAANSDAKVATQKAVKAHVANAVAGAVNGLSWKQRVRAATTASGTLASAFENGDTIDGVTLATGDRILIKNQSSGAENGIYVVAASGAPSRATDADSGAELVNATVFVSEGSTLADTQWTCTTNATITVGSTSLTFAQSGSGGITALTGDGAASGSGSVALTLATVNSNVGTFGDATHVAQVTFDAKGRATAVSSVAITGGGSSALYIYTPPAFANVTSLLHFDGTNGSTTITEQATGSNAWTAVGSAAISTAQSVLGGASLLVPSGSNSSIKTTNNAAWNVGSGDWAIEFRWRYNGAPQAFARVFATRDGDVNCGIILNLDTAGILTLSLSSTGSTQNILDHAQVMTLSQSAWNAVIVQRRGNNFEAFLTGALTYSVTLASATLYYNAGDVIIIGGNATGTSRSMNGYMDEFRFTKGAAVAIPNPVAYPSTAFPDS